MMLKFCLGDLCLGALRFPRSICYARAEKFDPESPAFRLPTEPFPDDVAVVQFPSQPVESQLPRLTFYPHAIRYVRAQYRRYSIDMTGTYDDYLRKFSSKTRFTLKKKKRRYVEHAGEPIVWRTFRDPSEIDEFYELARQVSERTYQERLLKSGLPDTEAFRRELRELAEKDALRGYILWDRERPVAFMCCPIRDGVVFYSHVGHDPDLRDRAPGVVLFVLALEQLFAEGRFRAFDFTEGEGPFKELFANQFTECADIYFFRRTLAHTSIVLGHATLESLSHSAGRTLERIGLKGRVRDILRSGKLWDRSPRDSRPPAHDLAAVATE